jgi:hypothetical protein
VNFSIRLERRFRIPLLAFGVVGRRNAYARLDGGELLARFGFFTLRTAIDNVERWEIQAPYRWWMAVGVRGTPGKPEITFGGSAHGGVMLLLHRPITRWWWKRNLRELYLTLDDPDGFSAELARRGIPGTDVRSVR